MCVATSGTNVDNSLQAGIILFSQYNIEKKSNDEDEDDDDSDFEGSKKALEDDLDGMACKFVNLFIPKYSSKIFRQYPIFKKRI